MVKVQLALWSVHWQTIVAQCKPLEIIGFRVQWCCCSLFWKSDEAKALAAALKLHHKLLLLNFFFFFLKKREMDLILISMTAHYYSYPVVPSSVTCDESWHATFQPLLEFKWSRKWRVQGGHALSENTCAAVERTDSQRVLPKSLLTFW